MKTKNKIKKKIVKYLHTCDFLNKNFATYNINQLNKSLRPSDNKKQEQAITA